MAKFLMLAHFTTLFTRLFPFFFVSKIFIKKVNTLIFNKIAYINKLTYWFLFNFYEMVLVEWHHWCPLYELYRSALHHIQETCLIDYWWSSIRGFGSLFFVITCKYFHQFLSLDYFIIQFFFQGTKIIDSNKSSFFEEYLKNILASFLLWIFT